MNKNNNIKVYEQEVIEAFKGRGDNIISVEELGNEVYRLEFLDSNNNVYYSDKDKETLDFWIDVHKGERFIPYIRPRGPIQIS